MNITFIHQNSTYLYHPVTLLDLTQNNLLVVPQSQILMRGLSVYQGFSKDFRVWKGLGLWLSNGCL